jgi:ligand-binding SRPBCC domain-containing protein
MPRIEISTVIRNTPEVVFDLARSVDLHKRSTAKSNESAIAGKTEGLMELGDWVTWRAKHFGIYQNLTSKITAFHKPNYFCDEMVSGTFKSFKHEHFFTECEEETLMVDVFDYQSPFSFFGKLADVLFLEKYMERFLKERNEVIREFAESERWREVLG